jgi:hypothetical protein
VRSRPVVRGGREETKPVGLTQPHGPAWEMGNEIFCSRPNRRQQGEFTQRQIPHRDGTNQEKAIRTGGESLRRPRAESWDNPTDTPTEGYSASLATAATPFAPTRTAVSAAAAPPVRCRNHITSLSHPVGSDSSGVTSSPATTPPWS